MRTSWKQTSKLIENIARIYRVICLYCYWGWSWSGLLWRTPQRLHFNHWINSCPIWGWVIFGTKYTVQWWSLFEGSFESVKVSNLIRKLLGRRNLYGNWIVESSWMILAFDLKEFNRNCSPSQRSKATQNFFPCVCCLLVLPYFCDFLVANATRQHCVKNEQCFFCKRHTRTWPCMVIRSPTQPQGSSKAVHTVEGPLWAIGSMCRWQNMLH